MNMDIIWFSICAIHMCLCVIQHPIIKILEKHFDAYLNIDYEKFWPFWSINISIFSIYTVILFLIAIIDRI